MDQAANPQPLTAAQEWGRRWTLIMAAAIGFLFHSVMTTYAGLSAVSAHGTDFRL